MLAGPERSLLSASAVRERGRECKTNYGECQTRRRSNRSGTTTIYLGFMGNQKGRIPCRCQGEEIALLMSFVHCRALRCMMDGLRARERPSCLSENHPCHIVRYVRLRVIDNQLGVPIDIYMHVERERERQARRESVEMLGVDVEQRRR